MVSRTMSRFDPHHKCPAACLHAVGPDASSTGTLLLSLSTIAGAKVSNPSWVNFPSEGWVSFQSPQTVLILLVTAEYTKFSDIGSEKSFKYGITERTGTTGN